MRKLEILLRSENLTALRWSHFVFGGDLWARSRNRIRIFWIQAHSLIHKVSDRMDGHVGEMHAFPLSVSDARFLSLLLCFSNCARSTDTACVWDHYSCDLNSRVGRPRLPARMHAYKFICIHVDIYGRPSHFKVPLF